MRTIPQGDSRPLAGRVSDKNGPVDLTDAVLRLVMKQKDGAAFITGVAVPDPDQDANRGRWAYPWRAGDQATPGIYQVEIAATLADGTQVTFPEGDPKLLRIRAVLG